MHHMLPSQSIAAMATLVAALITGAISFVTLTMTKEQKTSEFRQAWIDALRDELSQFLGAARAFARAIEMLRTYGRDYKEKVMFPLSEEKISDLRYQAAETLTKIQLRLNPEEAKHIELMSLLRSAITQQNDLLQNDGTDIKPIIDAIEQATTHAQIILKDEWKRVKKGELPFRIARDWVAPIIAALSMLLVGLILFGNFAS